MEAYILIAIIELVDGTKMPDMPIEMYQSYEACIEQARPPGGYKHIDKIGADWEVHKQDHAEIRDIDKVYLTCDGPIEVMHPEWEKI